MKSFFTRKVKYIYHYHATYYSQKNKESCQHSWGTYASSDRIVGGKNYDIFRKGVTEHMGLDAGLYQEVIIESLTFLHEIEVE